ncbi:hypothetical protein MKX01_028883 [Papaver californicum]|nr:hypothetical protein MKX01_028883 [Papaver californicum]
MENRIYPLESKFNELAQSNMRWTVHPERVTLLSKELKIDFVLEVSVVKASQIRLDTNCKVTWGFKVNFSEEKFPAWAKGVSYCSRFFYIRFEGNSNCLSS